MPKIKISVSELEQHLYEQLQFLRASCEAYDNGFEAEAKRIAHTVRVLVHKTGSSHALLDQLGKLNSYFFDTAQPIDPLNLATHSGLIQIGIGKKSRFFPLLDDGPPVFQRWRPFGVWWNERVFKSKDGGVLTRRDLILTAANQDGGSHVDPALDARYADLAKNNGLGLMASSDASEIPMENPMKAAVRQVGHEVLRTLVKGYKKAAQQHPDVGGFAWGMSIVQGSEAPPIAEPFNALLMNKGQP